MTFVILITEEFSRKLIISKHIDWLMRFIRLYVLGSCLDVLLFVGGLHVPDEGQVLATHLDHVRHLGIRVPDAFATVGYVD